MAAFGLHPWFSRWASASMWRPYKAWLAFKVLGPTGEPAIPGLIQVMRTSPNPCARMSAAFSLGATGMSATNALLDLVDSMQDLDVRVRDAASMALFDVAFDQAEQRYRPGCVQVMVPRLARLLTNSRGDTYRILVLLTNIGPDAKDAIPAVLPFMDSPNRMIHDAAVSARDRIMGH